ncbi:MAG: hypothetical protein LBS40_00495 [Burkholderiales bacterium]|jgi:hypothetical protein|nr:hypothetical protein [Burkholderiales bacterium]
MKYYINDYIRAHKVFLFDNESFKTKEVFSGGDTGACSDGVIKRFLVGSSLISLFDSDDYRSRSVFIGKNRFMRKDVFIKKRYRLACFDVYIIKVGLKTFFRVDFNTFDFIYKALDPTWDAIDEDHYDCFFKDFIESL